MVFLWEISTNSLSGQHEAEVKAGVALESLQSHEGFAQQHSTPGRAGLCDSHPQGMHFAHQKAETVFISHRTDLCQWKGRKSLSSPVLLLKLRPSKPDPSL